MCRIIAVALLLIGSFVNASYSQGNHRLPKFADYAVKEKFAGKVAVPILNTNRAQMFRTRLREGAKLGPNFAGHYRLVGWGAGLGAFSLAVIDLKTGKVYFPPFERIDASLASEPDLKGDNPQFQLNSKLLIFYGNISNPNFQPLGIRYYVLENGRFRLVRFIKSRTGSELQ